MTANQPADRDVAAVAAVLRAGWRDEWANRPNDHVMTHLAAALLPLIREREAAAWDEGWDDGHRAGSDGFASQNPYRDALAEPGDQSGEAK